MNTTERNKQAKQFILDKLELVSGFEDDSFNDLPEYEKLTNILHNLIFVKAKGFRGVVATAITGKYLNPKYDPLNDFYSCNPRSIFEQGIFFAFENKVPCGKSDPLNVAKNINVLDEEWAKGKRPQSAAQAAVDYLRIIEKAKADKKEKLINFFFFKLVKYANTVASIVINLPEGKETSSQEFGTKLSQFILKYPESGTTPQLVISMLLKKVYENTEIIVEGGDESVFGTNTTSKKPADIWLEKSGKPLILFEITVKKIDIKRLDDCLQSLNSLSMLTQPINFICRLPTDTSSLKDIKNGALVYKGKTFNFIDIEGYILCLSSLLVERQITEIVSELHTFIEVIDIPVTTKKGWNKIFL